MTELELAILLALTAGIALSGGLFLLGSTLRRRLQLSNEPPTALAWELNPPQSIPGQPTDRREVLGKRYEAGKLGLECEIWHHSIRDALKAIPTYSPSEIAQSAAGSPKDLEGVLERAAKVVEGRYNAIKDRVQGFDRTLSAEDADITDLQQQASTLLAACQADHEQAKKADDDAENAWKGMPQASNKRIWILLGLLIAALAIAALTLQGGTGTHEQF